MTHELEKYRSAILEMPALDAKHSALTMSGQGAFATQYAPFDYVNPAAKVVLVGITPGAFQATAALARLKAVLLAGGSDADALRAAKEAASFSGPMRTNLVQLLDAIGVQRLVGIASCADLFGARADIIHFTSALRYPVFLGGENYSGTPPILSTPYLKAMADRWLRDEASQLSSAIWVPLGREPAAALSYLVSSAVIPKSNVVTGLPHPSGANGERIAYFLGRKERSALSSRTNATVLDAARTRLVAQIGSLSAA